MNLLAIDQTERFHSRVSRPPFTESGSLRLFVRGESFLDNCRDSLAVLAHRTVFTRAHFPGGSLGFSALVHCLFLAFLAYSPRFMPGKAGPQLSAQRREERIYYRLPLLSSAKMPRLAPAGTGGRPGSGSILSPIPALGSTAIHPSMTI